MVTKKYIIAFCVLLIFFGCSSMQNKSSEKQASIPQIKVGMDTSQVKEVAGEPDIVDDWGKGKFIYYYKSKDDPKGQADRNTALPVFFENSQVFAIGWKMKQDLDKKNQTSKQSASIKRQERMLYEKVKKVPSSDYKTNYELYNQLSEINPQKSLYIKKRNYYKAEYDKRKKAEQDLYEKVKKIPASDYQANFEIYEKLVEINPDNTMYKEKKDYYKARLNKPEKPNYERAMEAQSCYIIGYRFGRCSAQTEKGLPCDQRNKVEIPDRCKNDKDTKEGIAAGRSSVN